MIHGDRIAIIFNENTGAAVHVCNEGERYYGCVSRRVTGSDFEPKCLTVQRVVILRYNHW